MRKYETVLSLALLAMGIYAISPLYLVTSSSAMAVGLATPAIIIGAGVAYIIVSTVSLIGVVTNTLWVRKLGMLLVGSGYLFATALRLLSIGPRPLLWVFLLALGLIAFMVRLDLSFPTSRD